MLVQNLNIIFKYVKFNIIKKITTPYFKNRNIEVLTSKTIIAVFGKKIKNHQIILREKTEKH